MRFLLNDGQAAASRPAGAVLLDVLREDLGLTGTKDACREGDCGSCLVLLGVPGPKGVSYRAVNSCLFPVGDAAGRHVVTIEGLSGADLSPIQQALVEEGAVQCGFCTPGLVVALTAFLLGSAPLTEADAVAALGGNICRCTGHVAIRRAAARLAEQFRELEPTAGTSRSKRVAALVARGVLPRYFLGVPARLRALEEPQPHPTKPPVVVAGGTDLYVTQAEKLGAIEPVFLSRRDDLLGVRVEDKTICIGAAVPLADIEASPLIKRHLPEFVRHFCRIASPPIRNRATLAGNLVNASPAADGSVMLLALDASVVLARGKRRRTVPLRSFFRGYKILDLAADETIAEIRVPVPDAAARFGFEKVARRERLDIASVNTAVRLTVRDGHIAEAHAAAGGVAPVPLYLTKTSELLRGRAVSAETAQAAAESAAAEASPISDVRGSAAYKKALLSRLMLAQFLTLFPDLVREEDLA